MIKIAIFIDTWNQINGVTSIYKSIVNHLKNDRYDLSLAIVHPSHNNYISKVNNDVILIGHKPKLLFALPRYSDYYTGMPDLSLIKKVKNTLGGLDLIHISTQGIFGLYASLSSFILKIPCIGFYHTDLPQYIDYYLSDIFRKSSNRYTKKIGITNDKIVYGKCRTLFCHTDYVKSVLNTYLSADCVVTSEFLDTSIFPIVNFGNFLSRKRNKNISIGYVGRLAIEKSIHDITNKFDELAKHNIDIHLVGDGPAKESLPNIDKVYCHGMVKRENLPAIYGDLDFLVFPSKTDTMGLTIIEAAACGLPAIVIKSTAPAELISEYDCGLTIDSFSSPRWITDLLELYNSDTYIKYQKNCLRLARDKSISIGFSTIYQNWVSTINLHRDSER